MDNPNNTTTTIGSFAIHYGPFKCQYSKHGDIQTGAVSSVTCHHCKARLGQEPHSDNPVWSGILAGAEWPSATEAETPAPHNPFENVFEKIAHDEGMGYELKDIPKRWAEQAKKQAPVGVRFASIAPRFEGENVKRPPKEGDWHFCNGNPNAWFRNGRWVAQSREYGGGAWPSSVCFFCNGLLPTQELHEGMGQEPQTDNPIRFASITPRFEGDNVKRAPIDGDIHQCKSKSASYAIYTVWSDGKREWAVNDIYHAPAVYCHTCGGLLPTHELHEGTAERGVQNV